jgi:2-polyprenyl-3-methyl-5-hydroxy-6-metoxy-1,4-benzoquinol methylase
MRAESITRNCPVCGDVRAQLQAQKGELRLVRCAACGMVYANPILAAFATGEYYDAEGAEYYLSAAKLESDYADVRFERELRLFRALCRTGAVLDVGCSSGAFLFHLNKRFPGQYAICGTDVSGAPLDYAESRGVSVVRGNFLEHDFGGRLFDALTLWAVIEHLAEPRAFLAKAHSLLKPGGVCFVLVPNMNSLAMRVLGTRYRYVYPQHLNYFTPATLRNLVQPGFTVVELTSTHFNPIVIWQDLRGRGRDVPNAERAELLRRTTAYKKRAAMKPVKAVYQLVEKMLAALKLADNLAVVLRKG